MITGHLVEFYWMSSRAEDFSEYFQIHHTKNMWPFYKPHIPGWYSTSSLSKNAPWFGELVLGIMQPLLSPSIVVGRGGSVFLLLKPAQIMPTRPIFGLQL